MCFAGTILIYLDWFITLRLRDVIASDHLQKKSFSDQSNFDLNLNFRILVYLDYYHIPH